MFAEPITLTVDTTDYLFKRKEEAGGSSRWFSRIDTTGEMGMKIRHSELKANTSMPKRNRHNVELTSLFYATATELEIPDKVYITFEKVDGDVDVARIRALLTWIQSGTILEDLCDGEN
jgi:hypothetical protein